MVLFFIDGMGTFTVSHALYYQILSRLDSHYITRLESGGLCGLLIKLYQAFRSSGSFRPFFFLVRAGSGHAPSLSLDHDAFLKTDLTP